MKTEREQQLNDRAGDGNVVARFASGHGHRPVVELKRDPRFRQLLALAREGDENAVADLWHEFDFDFAKEGVRNDLD